MASVDEIIAGIYAVKQQYEQAQQALEGVTSDTESTVNSLHELGAEKTAELLGAVKVDLDNISASSSGLASSLETAAQAAEASKG